MATYVQRLPYRVHLLLATSAIYIFVSVVSMLRTLSVSFFTVKKGSVVLDSFSASLTGDATCDLLVLAVLSAVLAVNFVCLNSSTLPRRLGLASIFISSLLMIPLGLEQLGYCITCFLGLQIVWGIIQRIQVRHAVSTSRVIIYVAAYIVAIMMGIGLTSTAMLIHWPFVVAESDDLTIPPVELDRELSQVLSLLSPYLFMLTLLAPVILKIVHRRITVQGKPSRIPQAVNGRSSVLLLGAGILTSILAGVYPFLPSLDLSKPLSVDFPHYVKLLEAYDREGFSLDVLSLTTVYSRTGFYRYDRVLSNAFLIFIYRISHMPAPMAVNIMPLILGPLFVVSAYLVGSELFGINLYSGICAYIAGTSYTVTIGVFAGYYCNWLANTVLMFLIWSVLRWQRNSTRKRTIEVIILWFILFLTHVYTWLVSAAILVPFFIFEMAYRAKGKGYSIDKKYVAMIFALTSIFFLVDYARMRLLGIPSIFAIGYEMLNRAGFSLASFTRLNQNLGTTFFAYAAGFSSNYLILAMAATGSYSLSSHPHLERLLTPFLALWLPAFILANPNTMQGRMLYAFPIVPLSAIGFLQVANYIDTYLDQDRASRHLLTLATAYVAVWNFNYLLRSMGTLAELVSTANT
ncbi:MAG: hypothetical protein QXI32_03525 [Candidatus Bathyarchaeia archaeon]